MEEIWFGDTPQWLETTISQFLDAIEGNENWNENDKKMFALTHLKGAAEDFSQRHFQSSDTDWNTIKVKLFEQFKCQINIWDKVEMHRSLVQNENESVRDFYNRCVSYQYIFCDDYGELVLDNDIMINFLHGLNRITYNSLFERLSMTENILDLNTCLSEAEVIETEMTNSEHLADEDDLLQQDHQAFNNQSGNYNVPQEEQFEYNPTPILKRENPNFKTEPQNIGRGISTNSHMMAGSSSTMINYQIPPKKVKQTIKSESQVVFENHNNRMPVISNIASMTTDFNSPTKRQGKVSEGFDKKPDGRVECLQCGKLFSRMDKAKNHAIKTHEPDQAIKCPLCQNYYAKNKIDWNEHVKKVHQMTAMDMKNIQIVYSSYNPMDPNFAKRPDGKVACLKCVDEFGCHKMYSRMDKAKAHFLKQHGPI